MSVFWKAFVSDWLRRGSKLTYMNRENFETAKFDVGTIPEEL